jgi:hypothetical protein
MSEEEEVCGAPLKTKDGRCDRPATQPDGRCGFHTQDSEYGGEEWKPNYKHGLYTDRGGYYKSLPEPDQEWIDAVTDDLIEKSYYDKDDISILEKVRQVAVDLHQRRRADEYIAKKGLTQEKDIGFHEEYGMITQEEENTVMVTKDRLSRESRMTVKDLGILDNDEGKTEEAAETLIESLSKEMEDD